MRSCPVCRSSDHNSQACDACGYSPASRFIEDEEDNDFLAHFDEGEDEDDWHEFDELMEAELNEYRNEMFRHYVECSLEDAFKAAPA